MEGFGKITLVVLVAVVACQVYADVESTTKCSLSFYRYLFNLPGEQIRPNVPEGTYVFGKRVGPPVPEGQASDVQPSVLKPASSYEAPIYLPPLPPSPPTTTTTTTTPRPSTSAPTYVPPPPPSPYYPAEASNSVQSVVLLPDTKPTCGHPEHQKQVTLDSNLLPPYRFDPSPKYQSQPTFLAPRFVPQPQAPPTKNPAPVRENEINASPAPQKPAFRYPVPTPPPQFLRPYVQPSTPPPQFLRPYVQPSTTPPQFLRPYVQSSTAPPQFLRPYVQSSTAPPPPPPPSSAVHENCENHRRPAPTPTVTFAPPTPPPQPSTTPEAPVVETRQNEIFIVPEPASSPQPKAVDCGHKHHNVVVESLGVPSTDYGVVSASSTPAPSLGVPSTDYGVVSAPSLGVPSTDYGVVSAPSAPAPSLGVPSTDYGVVSAPSAPAPSAGYSYDRPSVPFVSPAASNVNGYAYPKPSPSFEYPGGYSAQGTSLFESESPKSSDDGDLVILKV